MAILVTVSNIILVDDLQDSQNQLTRVIIDDDNEITPMWESQGQSDRTYYDYSNNETGITEQWGSLPTAIWSGNLEFGPSQENENIQKAFMGAKS